MHQCDDRNDSDDLKGIPSPSLSVCFENRTDEDVGRRKEDEVESPPSAMSFVLCRRKVPERIVTKPHISVTICVGFCLSQSLNMMTLAKMVKDVNMV